MAEFDAMITAVSSNDHVVAVMGPTGSGKSTFIATATGQGAEYIGHGLQSCTENVRVVKCQHPGNGQSVVFVDTPGFDATSRSDADTLCKIAEWLVKIYKNNVKLASIIYLHRISDNRMAGSVLKSLELFSKLCGQKALPSVVFATTMWNAVNEETGLRRQRELEDRFWNEMMENGCRTAHFNTTFASAWDIVGSLDDETSEGATLDIQEEMVVSGKMLHETTAFEIIREGIPQWLLELFRRSSIYRHKA